MNRDIDFYSDIIDEISNINNIEDAKNIFWKKQLLIKQIFKHNSRKRHIMCLLQLN